jgi:hypothetical protein
VRSYVRASDEPRFADLVAVRAGAVAALASEYADAPRADEAELRTHDTITRRVHDAMPSVPARFGALFDDPAALQRALAARDTQLERSIAALGTRIELAVTLRWAAPRPQIAPHGTSGRAYLEERAAREGERRGAEQIVERLVAELACERALIRQRICPRESVAATVAVLTTRDEEMNVRQRVESFGRLASEVSTDVYGPFPPYSFVS